MKFPALTTLAVLALSAPAYAATVSTDADTFGTITRLNGTDLIEFGGDGILPFNTNFSTFEDGNGNTLRVGLSATPRAIGGELPDEVPTNDGAGTFFVPGGLSVQNRTFWNFSFYAELDGDVSIQDIGLQLRYDLDPAAGTQVSDLGIINAALFDPTNTTIAEGSQNITFDYLSNGFAGFNSPPANVAFDPTQGEYSFLLGAEDFGSVGINVNVGDIAPVPLPAGLPLLLAGLGGLGLLRSRHKN